MSKIIQSDEKLVADYLSGDDEALKILISRYLGLIYSFVFRYIGNAEEAQDITQDVFVKFWRHLKSFDRTRKLKTWIFSIAKNSAIDFLRKSRDDCGAKKQIPFSEFDTEAGENILLNTAACSLPLASEIAEQKDISEMLVLAMNQLAPNYRMVLYLRYNDHFKFREIAQALGEPVDTIKTRHRRGLAQLSKLIPENFG